MTAPAPRGFAWPSRSRPREQVVRRLDWALPPAPVRREVLEALPADPDPARPPLLFVHGAWHGAWIWQAHWMPAAAERGWRCYAVSLRGHGGSERPAQYRRTTLRHYEHDVLQTIAQLPSPPVLVGHSLGGVVVQGVLERYRAAPAGVLLASLPPSHGLETAVALARHDPGLLAAATLGARPHPRPRTLFGPATTPEVTRRHHDRLEPEAVAAALQLVLPRRVRAVRSPVLVVGGGADRTVPPHAVVRTARAHGTRARLFRGMGHELTLEPGWDAVLTTVLDWLEATVVTPATS
jgi:pimeloyl-ACP methyl ester carboxylesterase